MKSFKAVLLQWRGERLDSTARKFTVNGSISPDRSDVFYTDVRKDNNQVLLPEMENGKFIMFAAGLDKANSSNLGGISSFAQHSPVVHSPVDSFAQHWCLNADAYSKLLSLSPDVQQSVMQGFSPPPQMTEVSGKFIMYAASFARERGQKRPFNQMQGLY